MSRNRGVLLGFRIVIDIVSFSMPFEIATLALNFPDEV
jgi:hypothetical protein